MTCQIDWNKHFNYEPDTGKLFWRISNSHRALAGAEVTSINGKGYLCVGFNGRDYKVHRIVWDMHNPLDKLMPGDEVDHIDHDKLNNRLSNQRKVSRKVNSHNQRKRATNTSGVNGVYFDKRRQKWIAQITTDGWKRSLGSFSSIEEAAAARKAEDIKHGFHENHGK